jgi:hypothetical protein
MCMDSPDLMADLAGLVEGHGATSGEEGHGNSVADQVWQKLKTIMFTLKAETEDHNVYTKSRN